MPSSVPGHQVDDTARENAALKIQKAWREKRAKYSSLDTDERWRDAAVHARLQTFRTEAEEGRNEPSDRWKRAAFLASRLQTNGSAQKSSESAYRLDPKDEKILETQHWLELTDSKHRYGSNLKYYHRRWLEEDTEENFFKWLDRGGGKDLSLPECSREQLEKERIVYLSPEQRLNYKVKIDEQGLLRWERNNELVDTTAGRWRDSGDGSGIVPFDATKGEQPVVRRTSFETGLPPSRHSSLVSAGSQDSQNATHYVETSKSRNPIHNWLRTHLTPKGWTELLLRKTVRRNTWIYVADRNFNLYIGIKNTGTFQHSSFLAGGLVVSAGLISVHNGLIHKLSPHSGHYRTKIDNFRHFVEGLEKRHVDLHRAEISRAELALWGIEHIKKFQTKKGELEKEGKGGMETMMNELRPSGGEGEGGSGSHWRSDILLGRKRAPQRKVNSSTSNNPNCEPTTDKVTVGLNDGALDAKEDR